MSADHTEQQAIIKFYVNLGKTTIGNKWWRKQKKTSTKSEITNLKVKQAIS